MAQYTVRMSGLEDLRCKAESPAAAAEKIFERWDGSGEEFDEGRMYDVTVTDVGGNASQFRVKKTITCTYAAYDPDEPAALAKGDE